MRTGEVQGRSAQSDITTPLNNTNRISLEDKDSVDKRRKRQRDQVFIYLSDYYSDTVVDKESENSELLSNDIIHPNVSGDLPTLEDRNIESSEESSEGECHIPLYS